MSSPRSLTLLTLVLAAGLHAASPEDDRASLVAQRLEAKRIALGLDSRHAFKALGTVQDADGHSHHRFQQIYQGVRVWGGDAIVHHDAEGRELPMTDALQRGIEVETIPYVDPSEALAAADRVLSPKGLYARAPKAELVLVPRYLTVVNPNPKSEVLNAMDVVKVIQGHDLVWHVHTELENGLDEIAHTDFFIDARTGEVRKRWSTLHTTGVTGTGHSQYSGTVTLNTNSTGTGYELVDTTRGTGGANTTTHLSANATYDLAHAAPNNATPGTLYTDVDNTWGDGANYIDGGSTSNANGQTAAVDAHYGLQTTWDFYKNVLGRNGIDNAGTATYNRVHFYTGYDNAFWSDGCFCMSYGDGSGSALGGFDSVTALDVAGHEMSHGVTAKSVAGGLNYFDESGGLNESNSDIFGTMVEFYSKGAGATGSIIPDTGGNWTIGEQLSPTPLRYMYKPSLDGASPDQWIPSLGWYDVHLSSGAHNRAFYFLSAGATVSGNTSTPNLPSGMTGVGNQKAAKIWYRALTTYLTSSSDYRSARSSALRAAADLYPPAGSVPSAEYQAVQNAYHGINVGLAADGALEDTTIPVLSNVQVTGTTGTITFSATATDNKAMGYVTFLVDGAIVGSATGAGPSYSMNVDSTTLPYGSHQLTAVAVDANGNPSVVSSPVSFSLANTSSQGILNGGFEQLFTGWTHSTYAQLEVDTAYIHGGSIAAWLGGYGQSNSDSISQTLTLPANATTLDLNFWLRISSQETGSTVKDTFSVKVMNAIGTSTLGTLATFSNVDKTSPASYVQHTYSLLPYKGQTVQLRFEYTEDSANFTSFRFDDVTLTESVPAISVSAAATANVVKGANKTFTATVSGSANTAVTWSITEGSAGGSITSGGVYTAPNTFGTYHVVATSVADPSKSATITVHTIGTSDVNASGKVDGVDLGLLAFKYGVTAASMAEDLNGDGTISDLDLDILLSEYGN